MIRLRSLYIAQFKRLQHVLKERKRKYCQAIHAEEEEETGMNYMYIYWYYNYCYSFKYFSVSDWLTLSSIGIEGE